LHECVLLRCNTLAARHGLSKPFRFRVVLAANSVNRLVADKTPVGAVALAIAHAANLRLEPCKQRIVQCVVICRLERFLCGATSVPLLNNPFTMLVNLGQCTVEPRYNNIAKCISKRS